MPVAITWLGQPDLEMKATPYTPVPCSIAQKSYDGRSGNELGVGSLPIGLSPADAIQAKAACINHVQSLLENPSLKQSLLSSIRTPAPSKAAMQSIHAFYQSMPQVSKFSVVQDLANRFLKKSALLHDALQFHLILNMVSRAIMFTDSSAAMIVGKLNSNPAEFKFFSSRMLDRQVKQILYLHNREVLDRILTNLEKVIRGRKASSWPVAFATIMTLCQSIELIQSQAVTQTSTSGSDPEYLTKVVEEAKQVCDSLEVFPFDQLSSLFHAIFRTAQPKEKGGINPFRDSMDCLDNHTTYMVKAIDEVMKKDSASSLRTGVLPSFGGVSECVAKANSGRLMFKFLSSFDTKAAEE